MSDFDVENIGAAPSAETPTPPAAAPADGAAPADVPPAGEGGDGGARHWSLALPEDWRELAGGFADAEEARAALERGRDYVPPKSLEDIVIDLPPEVQVHKATQDSFKQACLEHGITGKQAQALTLWQIRSNQEAAAGFVKQAETTLRGEWGQSYEGNMQGAMTFLTALDRRMNGELAPAMRDMGLQNHPTVIKALHLMSRMVSEDTVGQAGNVPPAQQEKTEDAYKGMFK